MVISAAKGMRKPSDKEAKEITYARVRDFVERFRTQHEAVLCRDLLGCNINTPEGRKEFEERHLHETHCNAYVRTASMLVEGIAFEKNA